MQRWLGALHLLLLAACVSVASISDLPTNLDQVRFGVTQFDGRWQDEYEFALPDTSDEAFYAAARPALTSNGFELVRFDPAAGVVLAKRGLRADEWGSVVGVYRESQAHGGRVKILFEVTQDATGSLVRRQYAGNIAGRIRKYLDWHSSGEIPFGQEHK